MSASELRITAVTPGTSVTAKRVTAVTQGMSVTDKSVTAMTPVTAAIVQCVMAKMLL